MNRLLGQLADALEARDARDSLRLCTQLEAHGPIGSKTSEEAPDAGACIRVLNELAARCKPEDGAVALGAARPHAATPGLEARVPTFFGTITTRFKHTLATTALAAAVAAVLAAAQAPGPEPRSDLNTIARQMVALLGDCVETADNKLLTAGAAAAVPGALRAVIWCCADPQDAPPGAAQWLPQAPDYLPVLNTLSRLREVHALRATWGYSPSAEAAVPRAPPVPLNLRHPHESHAHLYVPVLTFVSAATHRAGACFYRARRPGP